jgi:ribosomal protein S18 acetylase RimI-like enzyme
MGLRIRDFQPGDERAAYLICLKTGDHGQDGELFFAEDPDALGRIYVGPYLKFAPELAVMLEDDHGLCGYAMAVLDSRRFFEQYEQFWRPQLCQRFPEPAGDPAQWTRLQSVYHLYHHPDYFCPEPYDEYPSHLHIDLLPRAQGQGWGRKMIGKLLDHLRQRNSPGVHLGMSAQNEQAYGFYRALGFVELLRNDEDIYLGMRL